MNREEIAEDLLAGLSAMPLIDIHTHLTGGKLGARGLHDLLLYHMVISDLYAAGCPSGERLTQYPHWPRPEEAHGRIREAIPYLPYIQNTSCCYLLRSLLRDLYEWDDPITMDNWERLDAIIRERADDRGWQRSIVRQANIQRFCTEIARREDGSDDDLLQYALEWAFFTRCQWGEYDTALYELERCWGRTPESPLPVTGGIRPQPERMIHTVADVDAAISHYVDHIPYDQILSMATHISTDIELRQVTRDEMASALTRRAVAGARERDIYASYINETFLTALQPYADRLVFQFSLAAEPLPFETSSRVRQQTIAQVAEMMSRHPRIRFMCFVSSRHANQSLCTLSRELPNFSLAGYWWHNFFPGAMQQVMLERLDMLPMNKQVGFFSDAYCIEWAYAKALLVRQQFAQVLADKVVQGQYTSDEALEIARGIMYEAPQTLLQMTPAREYANVAG